MKLERARPEIAVARARIELLETRAHGHVAQFTQERCGRCRQVAECFLHAQAHIRVLSAQLARDRELFESIRVNCAVCAGFTP